MKEGEWIPLYIVDLRKVLAKKIILELHPFQAERMAATRLGGGPTHMWKYIC